jgi:hypothetical protein
MKLRSDEDIDFGLGTATADRLGLVPRAICRPTNDITRDAKPPSVLRVDPGAISRVMRLPSEVEGQ